MITEARSFTTRLRVTAEQSAVLNDACAVYGDVTRRVYVELKKGNADPRTELTASLGVQRWYIDSAMRRVKGILKSAASNRANYVADYERKAAAADKKAARELQRLPGSRTAKKRRERRTAIHFAKRRADQCRAKAARLEATEPTICFGSRALFRQQPDQIAAKTRKQGANAKQVRRSQVFATHAEWLEAWRNARSDELFSTGNAAVNCSNELLRLTPTGEPDTFDLEIVLPRPLQAKHGRSVTIRGVRFPYGGDVIADAVTPRERVSVNKQGETVRKVGRNSLAVRLKRDGDAWRLVVQCSRLNEEMQTSGATVGVDFNDGHLAVAIVGQDGNPTRRDLHTIPIDHYGGTQEQRRDAMAKAALAVVRLAVQHGAMIAIEKLDFKKKKADLREGDSPRRARMLSALAFGMFRQMVTTRAARNGLRVIEVNPAFTSFQGRVRYAAQLGTTVHHAAAIIIARRARDFSERARPYAGRTLRVAGARGHVAVTAPDWMQPRHVWSWWGKCYAQWKRAHEAQRVTRAQARGPTLTPTTGQDGSLDRDAAFLASF